MIPLKECWSVPMLCMGYGPANVQEVDGIDIKQVQINHLRASMALVQQEPVLFDTSIMANITYGLEDVPYARVVSAAQRANIHSFVLALPEVDLPMVIVSLTAFNRATKHASGTKAHSYRAVKSSE